jgi:hypothetical protein
VIGSKSVQLARDWSKFPVTIMALPSEFGMQDLVQTIATTVGQVADQLSQQQQLFFTQQSQLLFQHLDSLQTSREGRVEGAKMPAFAGKPHESVPEYIFDVRLFAKAKNINPDRLENQERLVAMMIASMSGAAASFIYNHVVIDQQPICTIDDFAQLLEDEFVPPDQQQRLRAALKRCVQKHSIDDYVARFRKIIAQVREMSQLDKVDRFVDGLKPDTRKEVNYQRCTTLREAISCAQAYERTHFERQFFAHGPRPRRASEQTAGGPRDVAEPTEIDVMDTRSISKDTCRKKQLCFYCKKPGHKIGACPKRPANQQGSATSRSGNGQTRQS